MNEKELEGVVLRIVLTELAKRGESFVPVSTSGRHVHLSQGDLERLFGPGYRLTKMRDLIQPGQYACQESVTMECEKGKISLRVVGPVRKETQVELSYTDCHKLGVKPMLRMSGDAAGTPGCTLVNGDRRILLSRGVMVAARHLHMSPAEAEGFGLRDGDVVALQVQGPRAAILENVVVRSGQDHSLEAHIDKDEANACGLADGQLCRVVRLPWQEVSKGARHSPASPPPPARPYGKAPASSLKSPALDGCVSPSPSSPLKTYVAQNAPEAESSLLDLSAEPNCLLGEEAVLAAARDGRRIIRLGPSAIITPLARDAAAARGIELVQPTEGA
ncbi:MAG: phosphate propanoyltransferase [Candidatus Limiplasma sp.]|nr:phosphate propanoyltransferase [Candidatus Limiplasma sp.]